MLSGLSFYIVTYVIMSQETKKCYYASGVFKVDYRSAGYKDLKELAQKWAKDENFYFLEVRKVSNNNWWFQFVYYMPTIDEGNIEQNGGPIKNIYGKELKDLYPEGLYAYDYHESDVFNEENVLVSKALPL